MKKIIKNIHILTAHDSKIIPLVCLHSTSEFWKLAVNQFIKLHDKMEIWHIQGVNCESLY